MKNLPTKCPSCQAALEVSSLSCTNCDTTINGGFTLPVLLQLPQDEQDFILNFVLSGGSLKAMAKQLGKSYPTVRNVLDDIIEKIKHFQKNSRLNEKN